MELESDIADSHSLNHSHSQQQQQQQNQHFHVLAVDDSLIDRKLLERLLTVSSYQVTCVESGNKALEYLGLLDNTGNDSTTTTCTSSSSQQSQQEVHGSKVNLIMTDYSMPGMSGYDLLKRVKGSSWKDIPVVVMSSENIPSRINMCLEGGAEEFLLKPVQLSDLRKLQSHLIKSLDHSCKTMDNNNLVHNQNKNNNNNSSNNINNVVDNENKNNNNSSNNNDKSDNNANKRKTVSPDQSSERRHKMKELMCYN